MLGEALTICGVVARLALNPHLFYLHSCMI
jgi:hypothetical protein